MAGVRFNTWTFSLLVHSLSNCTANALVEKGKKEQRRGFPPVLGSKMLTLKKESVCMRVEYSH